MTKHRLQCGRAYEIKTPAVMTAIQSFTGEPVQWPEEAGLLGKPGACMEINQVNI